MDPLDIVPIPAFQDNYLWLVRRGRNAAIVDPGDSAPVLAHLEREGLELTAIITTHHHADHIGGNAALLARFPEAVNFGPLDERIPSVTQAVGEGDRVIIPGIDLELEVVEIPGHTSTHVGYAGSGALFCGDTLFVCGCGRLFEGTPADMHTSLGKLATLPDDTRVYCAHEYTLSNIRFARAVEPGNAALERLEGEVIALRNRNIPSVPSTIAQEKSTNPFMRCSVPEVVESASRAAGRALSDPVSVLGAVREWKNRS